MSFNSTGKNCLCSIIWKGFGFHSCNIQKIYASLISVWIYVQAIMDFFKNFTDSISSDLQFVIDDISTEDSSAVGVTWHLGIL